jgi:uncharacterized protein YbjT (DUF2867 family)
MSRLVVAVAVQLDGQASLAPAAVHRDLRLGQDGDLMELVTGATGYIGSRLLRRLAGEGRSVRALARRPERVEKLPGVEPVQGDLLSGHGLHEALDGCLSAYYLVHSMEAAANGADFAGRDRRAAESFGRAAAAAGVKRIVYLGGIEPADGASSPHLRSRLEVERILLDAVPSSTALRASIVIGAESSSFRVLLHTVPALPRRASILAHR